MNASKSLSNISTDRNMWIAQYRREMTERDQRSSISAAHIKGKAEGRKEGRKEDKAEGKKETAKKLLAMNVLTIEQISQATGLSADEIAKL